MKLSKKWLALAMSLILLVGLVAGTLPVMAETEGAEETLVFSDNFDSGAWATGWRMNNNAQYTGTLANGVAALGYNEASRNLYDTEVSNAHVEADVTVQYAYNTKIGSTQTFTQYHLIAARSTNALDSGIEFGFKTVSGAVVSTLVVCLGNNDGRSNPLWESTETYALGTTAHLELYVVGSLVTAVVDDTVVYAAEVDGLSGTGKCGIAARYAVSGTSDSYTKAGYFDNFAVSTVTVTEVKLLGAVVADADGGVADFAVISGGMTLGEFQDAAVTVSALTGKAYDRYENVTVTTAYGDATADVVYWLADASKAVTSMSDSRWTGNSTAKAPNFTVDDAGVATLNTTSSVSTGLSVLNANNGSAYGDFYVEYDLTVSGTTSETRDLVYNYFSMDSTYGSVGSNTWDFTVFYDERASQAPNKTFWARLQPLSITDTSYTATYSDTFADTDKGQSKPMTVGMLVYDGTVTVTLNGEKVASYTDATAAYAGWFGLYVWSSDSTYPDHATVENFLYVPIPEKTMVDATFTYPATVGQNDETPSVTATPVYSWPYGEAAETAATLSGLNAAKLGKQTVTLTCGAVSKQVEIEVLDNATTVHISENFDSYADGTAPITTANGWYKADADATVTNGKLQLPGSTDVTAYIPAENVFADGYIEADITFDALSDTFTSAKYITGSSSQPAIYPMALITRLDTSSVRVRFYMVKTSDTTYDTYLQTIVFYYKDGETTLSNVQRNYKIADFALGQNYKVRLSVIGNYIEVKLDDTVVTKYTFAPDHAMSSQEGQFGFSHGSTNINVDGTTTGTKQAAYASVSIDNVVIAEQKTYTVTMAEANADSVSTQIFTDIITHNTDYARNKFTRDEKVVLTVTEPESKQLKADGLYYTLNGNEIAIDDRADASVSTPCNEFVMTMPAGAVTVTAEYVDEGAANIGMTGVSIREKSDTLKAGMRFRSRAYTGYTDADGTAWELTEIGTLFFKAASVTAEVRDACLADEDGQYYVGEELLGKRSKAVKCIDICDEFIDWAHVLTYTDDNIGTLAGQTYTAYAYAVYTDGTNTKTVCAETGRSYSYNDVAAAFGLTTY